MDSQEFKEAINGMDNFLLTENQQKLVKYLRANEDGYYEHLGGCIFVSVHSIEPITPIEFFERNIR
jgi:hypothetical protein